MAIIVGENSSGVARIGFTLGEEVVNADGPTELENILAEREDEDLVIVGPEVGLHAATEIANRYRTQSPKVGVILIRRRIDVQVLKEAMRSGIREVVSADDAGALLEACNRSREISTYLGQTASAKVGNGKIILVFAAKGGCGKTTVATNLAVAIADQSKSPTCLVDFDLEFGDVAIALQMEPSKTISEVVPIAENLDAHALSSVILKRNLNLDVLLAPRLPADSDFITPEIAKKVLSLLTNKYEYIVVDSPPAFTEVILTAFDMADEYVLITTLDMPAVKNLQVTLDTLDTLGYDQSKCHVIVNRSTTRSGLSIDDVEALVKRDIEVQVPSSNEVSAAINRGKALIEDAPRHEVSRAIVSLASRFVQEQTATKRKSLFRWRKA